MALPWPAAQELLPSWSQTESLGGQALGQGQTVTLSPWPVRQEQQASCRGDEVTPLPSSGAPVPTATLPRASGRNIQSPTGHQATEKGSWS